MRLFLLTAAGVFLWGAPLVASQRADTERLAAAIVVRADTEPAAQPDTMIPVLTMEMVAPVILARKNMDEIVRAHPALASVVNKTMLPLRISVAEAISRDSLLIDAVSRAGLTPQRYARVSTAVVMAITVEAVMRAIDSDMQAHGIVGENVAFVRNHQKELEPLGATSVSRDSVTVGH